MATANVTFMTAGGPSGALSAYNGTPLQASEDVASGAYSSPAPRDCYVRVDTDGAMRVLLSTASTPSAAATDMRVNGVLDAWVPAGCRVAVVDD